MNPNDCPPSYDPNTFNCSKIPNECLKAYYWSQSNAGTDTSEDVEIKPYEQGKTVMPVGFVVKGTTNVLNFSNFRISNLPVFPTANDSYVSETYETDVFSEAAWIGSGGEHMSIFPDYNRPINENTGLKFTVNQDTASTAFSCYGYLWVAPWEAVKAYNPQHYHEYNKS